MRRMKLENRDLYLFIINDLNIELPASNAIYSIPLLRYISSIELVHLFLSLQDKYNIIFNKEDVIDYRFLTIENIVSGLNKKLS